MVERVARRQQKSKAEESAEKTREKLLRNLVKHKALRRVLGQKGAPLDLGGPARQPEDMFQLPPPQDTGSLAGTSSSEDEEEEEDAVDRPKVMDLHSVNVKSTEFLSLPADVRHDILTELKETRKQSSWGRLHQMPKESSDFSSYQMSRLLKRRSVQVSLEDAEKEMGGRTLSLGELGELLADQGVAVASDVSKRIASDNVTRFVYVTESPKSSPEKFKSGETSREPSDVNCSPVKKIRLEETVQEPLKTEMYVSQEIRLLEEDGESSLLLDSKLQVARDFMLENSGLTQGQILSVIKHQSILGRDTSPRDALNTLESAGPSTSAFRAPSGALCDIDSDRINTDNQGLTQEQILAMIHSQQDDNTTTADSSGQGDSMVVNEETIDSNELGDHSKEENICVSESTDLNITVKHKVTTDVSVTNKYLAVKNSPVVSKTSFSRHSSDTVKQEGSSKMEIIESSTSDSDDFIDVSEPVSKEKALNTTMNVPGNTLAVTIQSTIDNKTLDSDIFADIFSDIDVSNLENIVKKVGVTGVVPRDETLPKDHSLVVKVLEDLSRGVTNDKSRNTSPITGSLQNVDVSIEALVGNEVIDHSEEEGVHRSSGDAEEEESKAATPKSTMEELQVLQVRFS
uniref:Uncharacterized protein n=1 Tax=Timema genevievae TaxID=629358 RepID=A0A7R9K3R0_TIMGE|nr:unnamed protein product [Timema genevievae]